jgi:photosystem II stability/assembly factor-like uncharacterized protein
MRSSIQWSVNFARSKSRQTQLFKDHTMDARSAQQQKARNRGLCALVGFAFALLLTVGQIMLSQDLNSSPHWRDVLSAKNWTMPIANRAVQGQSLVGVGPLFSVHFPDVDNGWAVGGDGVIVATVDAGATWRVQSSGTRSWLYAVHFHDVKNGWAVGSAGVIVATTDGGVTWRLQSSGTSVALLSVYFHNDKLGWATGQGGAIVVTTDSGATWRAQKKATPSGVRFFDNEFDVTRRARNDHSKATLNSVRFFDAENGWAVGNNGVILATNDGGTTWRDQASGVTKALLSVYFYDPKNGWAVGRDGVIVATRDAGVSWREQ